MYLKSGSSNPQNGIQWKEKNCVSFFLEVLKFQSLQVR